MKVIIDAEFDSLTPTNLWCIVCKDVDTGENHVFRYDKPSFERRFREFAADVSCWIGVNNLVFDHPAINSLIGGPELINSYKTLDLLIVSRLVWYARPGGHSVDAWAKRFGMLKPEIKVYDDPSMIEYYVHRCVEDAEIQHRIYLELQRFIDDPVWQPVIKLEHEIQRVCMEMEENGFSFDIEKAKELSGLIEQEMEDIERRMHDTIPYVLHRDGEIKLKRNKDGVPSLNTRPYLNDDSCNYRDGTTLSRFHYEPFNPGSSKQRIELLNRSGWKPIEKTKGHQKALRDMGNARRYNKPFDNALAEKIERFKVYGWKVNEEALETLPSHAPEGAHLLAQWLCLEGRRSDLDEWCAAYNEHSGRIHGTFNGLGGWTHRMSHKNPNQGNIFSEFYRAQCKGDEPSPVEDIKLRFNGVLRGLWRAEPGSWLVGADAEGIQLRVLAHYIDDEDYTRAIVEGKKEDETDIHNVNRKLLGSVCRSRDDAKTFIYAWLLGAANARVASILGCSSSSAGKSVHLFINSVPGLRRLKEGIIPNDAAQGFFTGLDGRKVMCNSEHLMLAGYLQNGESTIMKKATVLWRKWAREDGLRYRAVDLVHDEWQSEVYDEEVAHRLGQLQCDALIKTGRDIGLKCALAGAYDIGRNWRETH